jgi:hypothetical protein
MLPRRRFAAILIGIACGVVLLSDRRASVQRATPAATPSDPVDLAAAEHAAEADASFAPLVGATLADADELFDLLLHGQSVPCGAFGLHTTGWENRDNTGEEDGRGTQAVARTHSG